VSRRKPEPIDPAELPPPAVIAQQIRDDLRTATREIEAVIRSLAAAERPSSEEGEQLALSL